MTDILFCLQITSVDEPNFILIADYRKYYLVSSFKATRLKSTTRSRYKSAFCINQVKVLERRNKFSYTKKLKKNKGRDLIFLLSKLGVFCASSVCFDSG